MSDNLMSYLRVNYSTASAEAVAEVLATKYPLPLPLECRLLHRGFNDNFEVRAADDQRYVLRLSCRRPQGNADVAAETEFLKFLGDVDVPVAAPIQARDGALFTSELLPEGHRPLVLFDYAEGCVPRTGVSADARAQGVTLARIHCAAEAFEGRAACQYQLDLDHLLHRRVAAVLAVNGLAGETQKHLVNIASRLSASVSRLDGLIWTRCHGDCHGGNARIAQSGRHAGQAVFFDFDDGGPGYLAYDLAVYLWANTFFQFQGHGMWHAFVDGYRSVREISKLDFNAVHLFVPIRHIWLMGEYAGRIPEWGRESVSIRWLERQVALLQNWERERLSISLFQEFTIY